MGKKIKWIVGADLSCTCPKCGYKADRKMMVCKNCPNCGELLIEDSELVKPPKVNSARFGGQKSATL